MKFVNKLSVIGLVFLMFSFMNVANADGIGGGIDNREAPPCKGNYRSSCGNVDSYTGWSDAQKADACNNTYTSLASEGKATQCSWSKVLLPPRPNQDNSFKTKWSCSGGGGSCSTEN